MTDSHWYLVLLRRLAKVNPAGTWRLYNVGSTSMQRHDVASTFSRRCINVMCPLGSIIYSCCARMCVLGYTINMYAAMTHLREFLTTSSKNRPPAELWNGRKIGCQYFTPSMLWGNFSRWHFKKKSRSFPTSRVWYFIQTHFQRRHFTWKFFSFFWKTKA